MSDRPQVLRGPAVTSGMDNISGVRETALGGIQASLDKLNRAASQIATAPVRRTEPTELVGPLVDALEAQLALEASVKVLQRADEMLGTLLDTFA
jgi:flagellar hook-associated protein FlgK